MDTALKESLLRDGGGLRTVPTCISSSTSRQTLPAEIVAVLQSVIICAMRESKGSPREAMPKRIRGERSWKAEN